MMSSYWQTSKNINAFFSVEKQEATTKGTFVQVYWALNFNLFSLLADTTKITPCNSISPQNVLSLQEFGASKGQF